MIYINLGKFEGYPEIPLMQGKGIWGNVYIDEMFIPITDSVVPGIYDWYLVSNYGKIYHKYLGELLYLNECGRSTNGTTYYSINLSTINGFVSYRVHRLVMDCFYPAQSEYDLRYNGGFRACRAECPSSQAASWHTFLCFPGRFSQNPRCRRRLSKAHRA